ncbi:MAG: hypothetical protein E7470_01305 [Ruminococcaceae bacterium]|nr:hypothetical protein [Oscillospiraceae bacterium]
MNEDVKRTPGAIENNTPVTDAELDALIASIMAEDNDDTADRYGHVKPVHAPSFEEPGEPAFEDPDKLIMPSDPPVVRNYSNDYGSDRAERARKRAEEREHARREAEAAAEDRWQIILMGVASVLSLGILGVLIYWIAAFLS